MTYCVLCIRGSSIISKLADLGPGAFLRSFKRAGLYKLWELRWLSADSQRCWGDAKLAAFLLRRSSNSFKIRFKHIFLENCYLKILFMRMKVLFKFLVVCIFIFNNLTFDDRCSLILKWENIQWYMESIYVLHFMHDFFSMCTILNDVNKTRY